MIEHSPEKARVVADCPDCRKPLGLYYAECPTCLAHAGDYTYGDYEALGTAPRSST